VEVIESELEAFHVSEAVGLSLHGLDFVVEASQGTVGDIVGVIIAEQSLPAGEYR